MPASKKKSEKSLPDVTVDDIPTEGVDGGEDVPREPSEPEVDPLDAGRDFEPHPLALELESLTDDSVHLNVKTILAELEKLLAPHAYSEVTYRFYVERLLSISDLRHILAYITLLSEQGHDLQSFFPQYRTVSLGSPDIENGAPPLLAQLVYTSVQQSILKSSDFSTVTLPLTSGEAAQYTHETGPYVIGGTSVGDFYTGTLAGSAISADTTFEDGLITLRLVDNTAYHNSDEVLHVVNIDTHAVPLEMCVPLFVKVQNGDGLWRNIDTFGLGNLPGFSANGLPRVGFASVSIDVDTARDEDPETLASKGVSYHILQSQRAAERAAREAEEEARRQAEAEANAKGKKGKKSPRNKK